MQLDVSERAFSRVLNEAGINTRLKNRYVIKNEDYFSNIDTEFKAYILGFIYADGFVGTHDDFCISLSDKVYDNYVILNRLKCELDTDLDIKHSIDKDGYGHYTFKFSNKRIFEDLHKLNVNTCKSLSMSEIPNIDKNLFNHFIRGYFDGDGTICTYYDAYDKRQRWVFGVLGTELFLKKIQNIMCQNCDISKTKLHKVSHVKGLFELTYKGIAGILKIKKYLYNNATIYLTYKKEKFDSIQPL